MEEEKKKVEEDTSGEEKKFMKLVDYYSIGFITDAELKKSVQEKVIGKKGLIHMVLHNESSYVVESAARILSGEEEKNVDGMNITSVLIVASLPVEGILTESQKRIAEMAKQRPDYAEVKQRLVEDI